LVILPLPRADFGKPENSVVDEIDGGSFVELTPENMQFETLCHNVNIF